MQACKLIHGKMGAEGGGALGTQGGNNINLGELTVEQTRGVWSG